MMNTYQDSPASLKVMILPAEIKARELDSRILVGVLGAQKGWRVVFGSKSPLNRRVWKYGGDVYICQTLTKRRVNNLSLFQRLGLRNIGWDEEGLVYYGKDIYLSRRVSQESLSLMDGLVAWGEISKKDLSEKTNYIGLETRALGNPRMDLLRPELRNLYADEAKKITDKYGDFILLNTNFPSVNPHQTVGNARSKVMQADKNATSDAAQRFNEMQKHRFETLEAFLEVLPNIAERFSDAKIVVRPHPAENTESWEKVCRDYKNLHISQEGSVIPWLMAAKSLVHNGCTTAIEYNLLGGSAIAFCPSGRRKDESPLPNGVSHIARDDNELITFIVKSLAGTLRPAHTHKQMMDAYLSGQKGPMASMRVLDFCEEILNNTSADKIGIFSKVSAFIYCALRQVHRSTRMGDPARNYIASVFPQTSLQEVQERAERIRKELGLTHPIEVRACADNIFEISPGR